MIYVYIALGLLVIQTILTIWLVREQRKEYKIMEIMAGSQAWLVANMQFANDANEMLLWKIRYDILQWKKDFIENENYEMIKESRLATEIIADMIEQYRRNLKSYSKSYSDENSNNND